MPGADTVRGLRFSDRANLPNESGVYYVYSGWWVFLELLYIGESDNMGRRWRSHERAKDLAAAGATAIRYRSVGTRERRLHIEAVEILRLDPPYNRQKETPNPRLLQQSIWMRKAMEIAVTALVALIAKDLFLVIASQGFPSLPPKQQTESAPLIPFVGND